ncbi:hypothetical protein PACTADRAFT_51304 [Pachysolen tannophilus NRRL Y-2460]|uniref:Autophagy-related protein 3 n=1 Tax=Pachysolen tannophilus NRRL Y-2460 TaxID=669874 RepID=A0A1E4TRT4_PACTA|nr:hypothetical protein PACTADRAFT_51304 [Pachysolen tannophilus NRRL Y-2460]
MIRSTFSSWREYLTPVSHKSTFRKTGEITPEEFVEAGDYLVYKFPTWQWSPAPASKKRDFLPDNKQFLVTRRVPSYVRVSDYLGVDNDVENDEAVTIEGDDEAWTATSSTPQHGGVGGTTGISEYNQVTDNDQPTIKANENEEDFVDDIDELIDETAEEEDNGGNGGNGENIENNQNIKANNNDNKNNSNSNKRSYDLYVSYSTSYRVPKMYIVGFNSNGVPLSPNEMFEDIDSDYRHKTATIEKAPFLSNTTAVSIHPCKHAKVMKVLISRAAIAKKRKRERQHEELVKKKLKEKKDDFTRGVAKLGLADENEGQGKAKNEEEEEEDWESVSNIEGEDDEVIRVDQYLVIFLKFIASVTPGIEHDYTMDAF